MAWIEAHQELRDHPKTKRAARLLGISRPQMIGHLLCLWWWSMDYAGDGDLSDFDAADIADAAEWDGDADTFVSALVNCGPADRPGFLIENDGGLSIRDWSQYGGKYVTKLAQGRERQRTYRERNANVTQVNANETTSNADVTRHGSVSNTPREEKRREEKRREDEMRRDAPAGANASSQFPETDPEWAAAIGKLERASIGDMTGSSLLELSALWPDMDNGRLSWLDDAIRVAQANKARSPTYALRVLAAALGSGERPGQAPARPNQRGSVDIDAIAAEYLSNGNQ